MAYAIQWVELAAETGDLEDAILRLDAVKSRYASAGAGELAFWRIKAALAPAGPLRVVCRRLARGQAVAPEEIRALEVSESHPLRWSLLSVRPESIVECLQYSTGRPTRAKGASERSQRAAEKRSGIKSSISMLLDRTEAADSDA